MRTAVRHPATVVSFLLLALAACGSNKDGRELVADAESCMRCHNGSLHDDYAGPGLENPHPFGTAANLSCTTCHGGNGAGVDKDGSHVPPPPAIGDRPQQEQDAHAWFNKLTLAGMDKFADYSANGRSYTAIDYLRFLNPSDLRVTATGQGCAQCHAAHSEALSGGMLASETGILAGAMYAAGIRSQVVESQGLYEDTASDTSFRAFVDQHYGTTPIQRGQVARYEEFPVYSQRGATGARAIFRNQNYNAAGLADDQDALGRAITDSPLADLYHEQVAFTCGDCHLGSSGANNRYGDFRPSGCAACHMPYSLDGRSRSRDPNVPKTEPLDPDQIRAPERAHVRGHRIRSTKKTLASGESIEGIDDVTCAGCHQGSNRTVMQYWGIRLDQNQDVRRHQQYPANPVSFTNTAHDTRLFDPAVANRTFNGRNPNQYILEEDYDGDGRDDTPADVHYEAGMGCIDCHGGLDVHGGDTQDPSGSPLLSRMGQAVGVECESCHGTPTTYAPTQTGVAQDGQTRALAVDRKGRLLKNVWRDANGDLWLMSRLTGDLHFVPQTRDVIVDNGKLHPISGTPVYSRLASYAMGRDDGDPQTGIGPLQATTTHTGFSHTDNMDCASCHASWTNTCMGCHLKGDYNEGNNFSNITGDRIVYRQTNADFVYQSPVYFQLGVNAKNKITQFSSNTKVFYQYRDLNGDFSKIFAFSDRRGRGNDPLASPYPALSHNAIMAHSIRGRVSPTKEGPRYCVTCHLTTESLANWRPQYDAFRTAMQARNYAALDFNLLRDHIGKNPGNQDDSPFFVHMVAGLGSGLFLFDQNGAAVNPLDTNDNRIGSDGVAPATSFDIAHVRLDLDRIVEQSGVSNASSNHPMLQPGVGASLRDGSTDPEMAGPLGARLIRLLSDPDNGLVLDSWLDADGQLQGQASTVLQGH